MLCWNFLSWNIKTFSNLKMQEVHEREHILSPKSEKLIVILANGRFSSLSASSLLKVNNHSKPRINSSFSKTIGLAPLGYSFRFWFRQAPERKIDPQLNAH